MSDAIREARDAEIQAERAAYKKANPGFSGSYNKKSKVGTHKPKAGEAKAAPVEAKAKAA